MCIIFDFFQRGWKDLVSVSLSWGTFPLEAIKGYGVRASLLLSVWLQKPCRSPKYHFTSKAWCLARKPLNRIIKKSWRVWKTLAIFAGDLILAVKLKIRRLQQSRLVPPLQGGSFWWMAQLLCRHVGSMQEDTALTWRLWARCVSLEG